MTGPTRSAGVALLFLAGSPAITLVASATLFSVPSGDVPELALVLPGVGAGVGSLALLLTRPAVLGRIELVREGTARLAGGEFEKELPVEGRDEIAGLAEDFNRMARAFKEARARERGLEQSRRDLIAAVSHDLRTPPAGGTIFLRTEIQGEMVRVEVVDTGEEIEPEDLSRIFGRSFRGEESRARSGIEDVPRAGLGLAISRGLVEAHGGVIGVESEIDGGTRFYFTLRRP